MVLSMCLNCSLKYCKEFSISNRSTFKLFSHFVRKSNFYDILVPSSYLVRPCFQISTMPQHAAQHTTKNWKFIARDGGKQKDSSDPSMTACEEGHDAVQHTLLISELQKCTSVSSQIETFCSKVSITEKDIENRRAFSESFNEAFKIYFPRFKTYLFGSSMNGLGFKGCDTDVCLQTNFNNESYIMLKEVPTLQSVVDGSMPRETISRMNPLYMLRFIRRILRSHCPDIKEPILLIRARCPILRFYSTKHDVFCDFSCESKYSVSNTKLLRLACHLDKRFAQIAKVVRYWGKHGGFVGDIDMFNSYAFSLLVVYFLQMTNPPVLPSVSEMLTKSEYLKNASVDDTQQMLEDLKTFSPSANQMTVDELLRDFFFYFLKYDFSRIMQPFSSSSIPICDLVQKKDSEDTFDFSAVNIQDPFRQCFNTCCGANFKSCKRFLNGLLGACQLYQDDTRWVPGTEGWGLTSLFLSPLSERTIHEKWQQSRFHSFQLPAIPEAASKLRRVLEHGLMFHCTEFLTYNSDSNEESILKLYCKAYTNTWQGRDWVRLKYENMNDKDPLEIEHFISNELAQKVESKKQILCDFRLECKRTDEHRLQVDMSFKETRFSPIIVVFLREFIPGLVQKL